MFTKIGRSTISSRQLLSLIVVWQSMPKCANDMYIRYWLHLKRENIEDKFRNKWVYILYRVSILVMLFGNVAYFDVTISDFPFLWARPFFLPSKPSLIRFVTDNDLYKSILCREIEEFINRARSLKSEDEAIGSDAKILLDRFSG